MKRDRAWELLPKTAQRCDPRHEGVTATGGYPTLLPTGHWGLPHVRTYVRTTSLLGRLARARICKTNTGNDPLPVFSNHVSASQLPKMEAEDRFQQGYAVGPGKEIFPRLPRHQSDISIWRQDGNTPVETNVAFRQFFLA